MDTTQKPNKPRLWKKEPSGRWAWIVICPKCDGQVVILADSDVEAPGLRECAGCVRIKEKKQWDKIRSR